MIFYYINLPIDFIGYEVCFSYRVRRQVWDEYKVLLYYSRIQYI